MGAQPSRFKPDPGKAIKPVLLHLEGWNGARAQLRALAVAWYSANLQGRSFPNDDMGVHVQFASEGKNVAFSTSGNLRDGWRAEMVRALPELIKRAVKVAQSLPDDRRIRDTRMFHTLVAPLSVSGKVFVEKITLRETRLDHPGNKHKFYDIAALEIKDSPVLSGLRGCDQSRNPLPTGTGLSEISVSDLAAAIKRQPDR